MVISVARTLFIRVTEAACVIVMYTRCNALGTALHTTVAPQSLQEMNAPGRGEQRAAASSGARASSAHASPSAAHAFCPPRLATLPRAPLREEARRHEGAEAGGEGDRVRGDPARQRRRGGGA
eukprot:scaffold94414_cov69-Phaeocystis_antarctica.AAC.6